MTYTIKIFMLVCLLTTSSSAQNESGVNPPKTNPDMIKLSRWQKLDSQIRPITDQEVQEFCDYLRNSPVTDYSSTANDVGCQKAWVAFGLFLTCKDANQKSKIVEVMLDMLKRIQVVRDTLGVNPLSRTESYLYEDPPLPQSENDKSKDPVDGMLAQQHRTNEIMTRSNRLSKKIDDLETIYSNFYGNLVRMKIPLEGIPAQLERSPAEKARTKEFLAKRAAERGRMPTPAQTQVPAPADTGK